MYMYIFPNQCEYPWWTSCPSLGGVVQELMMSGVLAVTLPHLQDSLLPLFQLMDSPNARVSESMHVGTVIVLSAMQCTLIIFSEVVLP